MFLHSDKSVRGRVSLAVEQVETGSDGKLTGEYIYDGKLTREHIYDGKPTGEHIYDGNKLTRDGTKESG